MFAFLTFILILDAIVLITAILLQAGTGGGLAALGGGSSTDSFLGGRQATTILTKLSWWCGGKDSFRQLHPCGHLARVRIDPDDAFVFPDIGPDLPLDKLEFIQAADSLFCIIY